MLNGGLRASQLVAFAVFIGLSGCQNAGPASQAGLRTEAQIQESRETFIKNQNAAKAQCRSEVEARHATAMAYFRSFEHDDKKNGKFDQKYAKETLEAIEGLNECRANYLNNLAVIEDDDFVAANRANMIEDEQLDRAVITRRLSFSEYRAAQRDLDQRYNADLADRRASRAAAIVKRREDDAREAAEREQSEQETAAQNTAMMGMMMGMMNRSAFVPRNRGSRYVAPTVSTPTPAALTSSAPATPKSTYRDATYCASIAKTGNPDIINVGNSCSQKITVWMGGEFVVRNPGQTKGYTTIARSITYACFNGPREDICEC